MALVPKSRSGLSALAGGIVAGGVSAGLFALALARPGTLLIFLAYVGAVPIFIAGLGAGMGSGLVASIGGTAGLLFSKPADFALLYFVIYAAPAALLTIIALRNGGLQRTESKLLTAVTIYPCVIFLAVMAATFHHDGGLLSLTGNSINAALTPFKGQMEADTAARLALAMDRLAKLLPALLGCSWIFLILISLVVAQQTVKSQTWNLRPNFALLDVSTPVWTIFAAAATGLAGAFAPAPWDYAGTNLCIMLCVPFFFVGLAVVHAWAGTTKAGSWILVLFYVILVLLVWTALFVTALGVLDQWANFRPRFAAGSKQGGK